MNTENFIYRFYSDGWFGNRVSIAAKFVDNKLSMSASRCSDTDNFCKKTGRSLAEKRLNEGRYIAIFPMKSCDIKTFRTWAEIVANNVSNNPKTLEK